MNRGFCAVDDFHFTCEKSFYSEETAIASHDSTHIDGLISLKPSHTIFFLVTVLSLPQPHRQQEGKCCFTTRTLGHITGKLIENAQMMLAFILSTSMPSVDYQRSCCCCCGGKKPCRCLLSLIYFSPHHYLIFGYKHTDCAAR